jgi:ATP-dependent RNA helicase DDX18/HAS1
MSCFADPREYIHRVGRTARGAEGKGKALLFLLPEELGFLKYLRAAKVALNEYEFPDSKVARVQKSLEELVGKNYYLNKSAKEAYRSYLLAYASHGLKHIFDVNSLDLAAVSRGFGFTVPPRVNLNIKTAGIKARKRGGGGGMGDQSKREMTKEIHRRQKSGLPFSATNPYGKRDSTDKRQFAR